MLAVLVGMNTCFSTVYAVTDSASYETAHYPEQKEFSVPNGIKPSEIVGAYKKQGGKIIGNMIPNPNFGGN